VNVAIETADLSKAFATWGDNFLAWTQDTTEPGFKLGDPKAMQTLGKTNIGQARELQERLKVGVAGLNDALISSATAATTAAAAVSRKVLEDALTNSNTALDYAEQLLAINSLSALADISAAHTSRQIQVWTEQARAVGSLSYKAAVEVAEPIKSYVNGFTKKADQSAQA
jgi:hypothetical protein